MNKFIVYKFKVESQLVALLSFSILLYPPFFFSHIVSSTFRIASFIALSAYLLISNRKYYRNDVIILLLLFLNTVLMVSRNDVGLAGIFTIGNYTLTIVFGWALSKYLAIDRFRFERVLALYVNFFYFAIICSALSVIYMIIFGELDLFSIKSEVFTYLVTPFGVLLKKDFGSLTVMRSYFYFVEPIYLGVFSAINIFMIAPLVKNNPKRFVVANLLGGILTFSISFYLILLILYLFANYNIKKGILFGVSIIVSVGIADILSYSSVGDRLNRFILFLDVMGHGDVFDLLFGHGVLAGLELNKGFSSGLLIYIFELGLLGTGLIIFIFHKITQSKNVLWIFMLLGLIIDPAHIPLFWLFAVLASLKEIRHSPFRIC